MPGALSYLEIFFNSGQIRQSFGADGESFITREARCFGPAEQRLIASLLVPLSLEAIGGAGAAELLEIAAKARSVKVENEDALEQFETLMRAASGALGVPIFFNNKFSELEVVLSSQAVDLIGGLRGRGLEERVNEALGRVRERFECSDFQTFTGVEYCKITRYDKAEVAARVLQRKHEGCVLAFGDSAVDISFLALRPESLDYQAYYVGDPEEVAEFPHIACTEPRGCPGMHQLLKGACEKHLAGTARISALISDIDNCLAPLDGMLEPAAAALLAQLLQHGVQTCLITGGHIDRGYQERIVAPLRHALAANSHGLREN